MARGFGVAAWLGRCEIVEIGGVDEMNGSCSFVAEEMLVRD